MEAQIGEKQAFLPAAATYFGANGHKGGIPMKKHLAIATWDADSVELYARQVRDFLGEHIQISTYSVQGGPSSKSPRRTSTLSPPAPSSACSP